MHQQFVISEPSFASPILTMKHIFQKTGPSMEKLNYAFFYAVSITVWC
jgi:hypothetical protein